MHFRSIKGVYFLQNANNLTFKLFLGCIFIVYYITSIYSIFSSQLTFKSWILTSEKNVKVVQIGGEEGEVIWTKSKRTAVFPRDMNSICIVLII